jgi:hypothetical protein
MIVREGDIIFFGRVPMMIKEFKIDEEHVHNSLQGNLTEVRLRAPLNMSTVSNADLYNGAGMQSSLSIQ